ncbi:MAG: hypothetical protein R2745_01860 [Vicinamibacterales bacterium]
MHLIIPTRPRPGREGRNTLVNLQRADPRFPGQFSTSVNTGTFGGVSFMAQAARGFRDPVLSDRYFRGPSGRGFKTAIGTSTRDSLQLDSVLYTAHGLRTAVFGYRCRLSDLVEHYRSTPGDFRFRNRRRAEMSGVEAEAKADLPGRITVDAAIQLDSGRALDLGEPPRRDPPAVNRPTGAGAGGLAQARLAHDADDERPGPTERLVPGYTLADLGAGVTVRRRLELRGLLCYAFDQEYYASQDTRAVFAPGRAASITVVVRF